MLQDSFSNGEQKQPEIAYNWMSPPFFIACFLCCFIALTAYRICVVLIHPRLMLSWCFDGRIWSFSSPTFSHITILNFQVIYGISFYECILIDINISKHTANNVVSASLCVWLIIQLWHWIKFANFPFCLQPLIIKRTFGGRNNCRVEEGKQEEEERGEKESMVPGDRNLPYYAIQCTNTPQ